MPVGTITYGNLLEELVNRKLLTSEVAKTVFKANKFFDLLDEKSKPKTGAWIEFPIALGKSGTAKMFTIYGTTDAASYAPVEKVKQAKFDWKNAADFLRISGIQMQQVSGPEQLVDFVESQTMVVLESLRQLISDQLFTGSGLNENAVGLETALDNADTTGLTTYGGISRAGVSALQANEADARDVNSYNGATNGNAVFTNGSTVVGEGGTPAVDWDTLNIYPGGRLVAPDGRTYIVMGKGVNQIFIDRPYEGASATSTSWTYTGLFNDTTTYGGSGVFTAEKVDKIVALCTDGNDHPTDILVNSLTFSRFLHIVQKNQRFTGTQTTEIGSRKYLSLYFDGADVCIDNHAADGTLYVLNLNYWALPKLKGYDRPQLRKGDLVRDVTGTRIQSWIGEVVCVFALMCRALNRQGVLRGLTV